MTLVHAILIIAVPVLIRGIVIWLVFRNINRKYCDLFRKLVLAARENPRKMQELVLSTNNRDRTRIVDEIAAIEEVEKVDIIQGRQETFTTQTQAKSRGQARSGISSSQVMPRNGAS